MSKRSIMSLSIADEDLAEQGERMMVFLFIQLFYYRIVLHMDYHWILEPSILY